MKKPVKLISEVDRRLLQSGKVLLSCDRPETLANKIVASVFVCMIGGMIYAGVWIGSF